MKFARPGSCKRVPAHLANVKHTRPAVVDRSMFRAIVFTPATLYRAMDGPLYGSQGFADPHVSLSAAVVPPATSKNCSVVVLCLRSYQLARSLSAAVELLATSKTAQLYSFKPKQRTKTHVPHLDSCLRCAFQLPASSRLSAAVELPTRCFSGISILTYAAKVHLSPAIRSIERP